MCIKQNSISMSIILNLMLLLSSCGSRNKMNGINLYPNTQKTELENSTEQSVNEFFQRRMRNNEFEKIAKKSCEILATDSNYVYFGYPYGLANERKVDTIFKTNIQALRSQFPAYQTVEGYQIRNKINNYLKPYIDSSSNYTILSTESTIYYSLEPDKIKVSMDLKETKDFIVNKKTKFIIELDKQNLELLSIQQL